MKFINVYNLRNVRDIKYKFLIFISFCVVCLCTVLWLLHRPSPRHARSVKYLFSSSSSSFLYFLLYTDCVHFLPFQIPKTTDGTLVDAQIQHKQTHSIKYYTNLFSLIFHSNSKKLVMDESELTLTQVWDSKDPFLFFFLSQSPMHVHIQHGYTRYFFSLCRVYGFFFFFFNFSSSVGRLGDLWLVRDARFPRYLKSNGMLPLLMMMTIVMVVGTLSSNSFDAVHTFMLPIEQRNRQKNAFKDWEKSTAMEIRNSIIFSLAFSNCKNIVILHFDYECDHSVECIVITKFSQIEWNVVVCASMEWNFHR